MTFPAFNSGIFFEHVGIGVTLYNYSTLFIQDTIAGASGISELRDIPTAGANPSADTDPNWPTGSSIFGARFYAKIDVPSTGYYTFGFGSDDAGYVYINGTLIAAEPGLNGYPGLVPYTVYLTAGIDKLTVYYANESGPGAVLALALGTLVGSCPLTCVTVTDTPATPPSFLNLTSTPLPTTWTTMLTGLGALGLLGLRRKRKAQKLSPPDQTKHSGTMKGRGSGLSMQLRMSACGPEPPRRPSAFVSVIGSIAAAPAGDRQGGD